MRKEFLSRYNVINYAFNISSQSGLPQKDLIDTKKCKVYQPAVSFVDGVKL